MSEVPVKVALEAEQIRMSFWGPREGSGGFKQERIVLKWPVDTPTEEDGRGAGASWWAGQKNDSGASLRGMGWHWGWKPWNGVEGS